jgi:hypothetical protein
MYAIRRLQVEPSGTWCWRVTFSRAGRPYNRSFYDPTYGGSRGAKKAAVAWRDEQLARIKAMGILDFCQLERSNNTSGTAGVSFVRPARQPERVWQARLKLDGGPTRTKSFSVRMHGYEEAHKRAVAARQQMLAETTNRAFVHAKEAKIAAALNRQRSALPLDRL